MMPTVAKNKQSTMGKVAQHILCYGAWLVLSALGIFVMMRLLINIADISHLLGADRYARGLIDKVGIYVLGLIWFTFIFVAEAYLRNGIKQNILWQRIARIALVQALLLGMSYGLQEIFIRFGT